VYLEHGSTFASILFNYDSTFCGVFIYSYLLEVSKEPFLCPLWIRHSRG